MPRRVSCAADVSGPGLRRARQLDHVGVHDLRGDELALHLADQVRACSDRPSASSRARQRQLARGLRRRPGRRRTRPAARSARRRATTDATSPAGRRTLCVAASGTKTSFSSMSCEPVPRMPSARQVSSTVTPGASSGTGKWMTVGPVLGIVVDAHRHQHVRRRRAAGEDLAAVHLEAAVDLGQRARPGQPVGAAAGRTGSAAPRRSGAASARAPCCRRARCRPWPRPGACASTPPAPSSCNGARARGSSRTARACDAPPPPSSAGTPAAKMPLFPQRLVVFADERIGRVVLGRPGGERGSQLAGNGNEIRGLAHRSPPPRRGLRPSAHDTRAGGRGYARPRRSLR